VPTESKTKSAPKRDEKTPHAQLKKIRGILHLSQAQMALLLGVEQQYLVSVETGQRELSRKLAGKIATTFGIARIGIKHEMPLMRGPNRTLRPFTKSAYQEYASTPPSFREPDTSERLTPTVEDYARSAHALLEAARRHRLLRPVLVEFFDWFQKSIVSDTMFYRVKECFDELFPGQRKSSDAFLALTINWGERDEDDYRRLSERREAAAARAARKRTRQRKK
jgi:DNA-binding XRE family transcriptional regulator